MKSKFIFLLILLIFAGNLVFSDTIYLKTGKELEGVVHDSGGPEVQIETSGGALSVKRNEISEIRAGKKGQNLVTQAKSEEIAGNYKHAIELYFQANQQAAGDSEKSDILVNKKRVLEKFIQEINAHDLMINGITDIAAIEDIKRYVSESPLLSLLQTTRIKLEKDIVQKNYDEGRKLEDRDEYQKAIDAYTIIYKNFPANPLSQNLNRIITALYIKLGEKESRKGTTPNIVAYEAFKKVLEFTPGNSKALYYMGCMLFKEKKYEEAQKLLKQISPSDLNAMENTNVTRTLSSIDRLQTVLPTPTPQPVYTPAPTPEPELTRSEKFSVWMKDTWGQIKQFFAGLLKGNIAIQSNTLTQIFTTILYLSIFVLIYWYIPMRILWWDLPRRKVVYYDWKQIVKFAGIFGLVWYYIDRLMREEKKKRCPACNRAIDNPELFDNYNFDVCPYCQAKIKPPFTMPEIIQGHAQMMAITRTLSSNALDEAQRQQMMNFLQLILIHGRKIRASDIHVEPEEGNLLFRYRVDGVLTDSIPVDISVHTFLVSCIKIVCNLNIAEKRLPQDGHFRRVIMNEEINIRVSTIPTRLGEKVVMRLLDKRIANASLDSLGLEEEALVKYRSVINSPHGLILATGPTGSGKTTLQYSSLQFINDGTKNIITVEDPIEYELEGINQVQHNTATGLTFATALRSILRQDPDVIMIGEIRDLETATIAVNAALTGHLVFSTVHTIDTSTALSRLIDMGVDVKLLSTAILSIVAQRLVRKLCPHCKKKSTITAKELGRFGAEAGILEGKNIYRPKGCRECSGTGYTGRTGIYEMLFPNKDIRTLIEKGGSSMDIRQSSRKNAMRTLREEGVSKVLAGITSIEEIIRVTTEDILHESGTLENESAAGPLPKDN